MNRQIPLLCLVLSIVFVSCDRELVQAEPQPLPPSGDTTLVKKIIMTEVDEDSGEQDTVLITTFQYDDQKRLTQYRWDDPYMPGIPFYIQDFFYNGSETLPFKSIARDYDDPQNYYKDTIWYYYKNGFVSNDSMVRWEVEDGAPAAWHYTKTATFTPSGENFHVRERSLIPSAPFELVYDGLVTVTRQNGLIVKQTTPWILPVPDHFEASYTSTPHPLYNFFPKYPVASYAVVARFLQNLPASSLVHGDTRYRQNFSYTFRNDGMPLTTKITDGFGSDFHYMEYYSYE